MFPSVIDSIGNGYLLTLELKTASVFSFFDKEKMLLDIQTSLASVGNYTVKATLAEK